MNTLKQKTLGNTSPETAKANVPDIKIAGDPSAWVVVCKASSETEGWMKSTKAMPTATGLLVQVTTQQRNSDETYSVAEALTFVQGSSLVPRKDGTYEII